MIYYDKEIKLGNVLHFREEDLIDYIVSFMGKLEVPAEDAKIVGDVLVEADFRGINVNEEKLAYNSLKKVAYGKDFLTDSLTLKYLRSDEHINPIVSNRKNYEIWRQSGSPDIVQNSEAIVEEILKNYKGPLLEKKKQDKIGKIINEFECKSK